jgi:hypothetical protein
MTLRSSTLDAIPARERPTASSLNRVSYLSTCAVEHRQTRPALPPVAVHLARQDCGRAIAPPSPRGT